MEWMEMNMLRTVRGILTQGIHLVEVEVEQMILTESQRQDLINTTENVRQDVPLLSNS